MVTINILGDFSVKSLDGLTIGKDLQRMLDFGDINVVNFEAPIHTSNSRPILKSGPSLSQDSGGPQFLMKHKFSVFTLANNHIMDFGKDAVLNTINSFGKSIILGCGLWDDAYEYKIIELKGLRVGFMAMTQYEFGVLGEKCYNTFGTAWLCHPCVDELILEAKNHCDYLILLPHAGLEHFDYPLPELRSLYRHFVNIGADAVIGNHPHVPQPWENYGEGTIVYSLGNFVFDSLSPQNKYWHYGLMAQLKMTSGNKINVDIRQIAFNKDKREVDCCYDENFKKHLDSINNIFKNAGRYIQEVNNHCMNLEFLYNYQFECSGYIRPNIRKYSRAILTRLKSKVFKSKSKEYNPAYYINNLRCEPHRWVISRIFELKYKTK